VLATQGEALAEVLRALLDPRPERRPEPAALLAALAPAVGRPLEPRLEDLQGALRPSPPLLGREQALARVERAIAAAGEGRPSLLALRGVGKSRLAREACVLARAAGLRVLEAADARALRLGAAAGAEDSARRASLLVDALLEERGSWLLCLDPVPRQDAESARLLAELPRALSEGSHAVVLFAHEGAELDEVPAGWELLDLRPLTRAEATALAVELAGSEQPAPLWTEQVFARTGGDPRLVVEVVQAQLDAGLPEQLVPATDRGGLLAGRVSALPELERELLVWLATTPRPLSRALLDELVPGEGPGAAIAALLRRGLAVVREDGLAPACSPVVSAALAGEPAGRLRERHARLAHLWRDPAARWLLGHHLLEAGQLAEAAATLDGANDARLEDLARLVEALPEEDPRWPSLLAALARRRPARGELELGLEEAARLAGRRPAEGALLAAELCLAAGQPARALEALATLPAVSGDTSAALRARASLLRGRAHVFLGRYAEAAAEAARGFESTDLGRELEAPLTSLAGLAAIYLGRPEEGLEALERADALAATLEDRETQLRVASARGIALSRLGRAAEAGEAYARCAAQARALGDLRAAANASLNLGTLAHGQLELEAALEHYRRAGVLAHRGGVGTTRIAALSNEANLLLLFGALAEAVARLDEAEALAREAGARAELGYLQLYRAEARLLAGDLEAAGALLETARAALAGDASGLAAADLLLGELCAQSPLRQAAASQLAAELRARVPWESSERWRVHLLAGRAALAALAPDRERARVELQLAAALALSAEVAPLAWEAQALLARCEAGLGHEGAAALHAAQARSLLEELRVRVPPLHRASFDARPEVQRQVAALAALPVAPAGGEPSPADLQRLLALNHQINQRLPLAELLGRILDCAIELTGAERGFVLLDEAGGLRLAAARNVDGEALRRGMEKLSQTIAGLAILEGRPIVVGDAMEDARFMDRCSITGLRLRAVLCAPFQAQGGGGALYVDNRFRAGAFTPRHRALIESFADQVGLALTNARLVEELSAQARELERAKAQVEGQRGELEARVAAQDLELTQISVRLRANEEELVRKYNANRIIGRSKAMRELFASLDRVAEADVPVLIWGESGTGKELVARALHACSPRREHPFICINCGAVAPTLLESELFGHARGAFTGAMRDRPGLFEAAGQGTLLLDEVGDMPPEMQVKLLRILQEGSFRRVGEERERRSACRVLSASHKRVGELVAQGLFREDLYYRLQVIQLEVPALRDRREDLPLLVEHLLAAARPGTTISPAAMAALLDHDWPGNVRQLENELRRAAVLCDGVIEPAHLSLPQRPGRASPRTGGLREELRRHERQLIEAALREAGGQVAEVARALDLHRVVLYRRMRELGLPPPREAPAGKGKRSSTGQGAKTPSKASSKTRRRDA